MKAWFPEPLASNATGINISRLVCVLTACASGLALLNGGY